MLKSWVAKFWIAIVALSLASCSAGNEVGHFEIVGIEGIEVASARDSLQLGESGSESRSESRSEESAYVVDIPREVVLRVSRSEGSRPFKILEGRVRVSYSGRRVAILNLAERVKLASREQGEAGLRFRLSMTRNSQSLALLEALRRGDWEHIEVDWEFKVRSGLWHAEVSQPTVPLEVIYKANNN